MLPKSRFSQNTLILLANNGATAFLAFGLTIIIARGLGSRVLGQYAAVMAWILPLSLLGEFGIGTLITRNVAQNREAAAAYLKNTHRLRWVIGGGIVLLVWIFAPLLSDDTQIIDGLRLGVLLVMIDAIFASYTAVFRAWEMMWPILILNTMYLALQVIGALVVVAFNGSMVELIGVIVAADVIQLAVTWGIWKKIYHPPSLEKKPDLSDWGMVKILQQAWPFMVAGVLATLQLRMVFLILQANVSTEAVGWYAAASRVVEAARILPNAAFGALFPMLAGLIDDPPRMNSIFRRAALLLSLYGVMVGLTALIGAQPFVQVVFGPDFEKAGVALIILAWGILPGGLRGLITLRLYAIGREWTVNWITAGVVVAQIGIGIILIGKHGITGAAWTIVLAEILLAGVLFGAAGRTGDTMSG